MFLLSLCLHQDLLHLEERLGTVNRGASQGTIERCTYPHKYKKVKPAHRGFFPFHNFLTSWGYMCMYCCSVFWDRVRSGLLCSDVLENTVVSFTRDCSREDNAGAGREDSLVVFKCT